MGTKKVSYYMQAIWQINCQQHWGI